VKLEAPTTAKKSRPLALGSGKVSPYKKGNKVRLAPRGHICKWGRLSTGASLRPRSAYALWAKDNRKKIQAELGTADFATVSRVVGERWAATSAAERAPYEKRREEMRSKYEAVKTAFKQYASDVDKLKKWKAPRVRTRAAVPAARAPVATPVRGQRSTGSQKDSTSKVAPKEQQKSRRQARAPVPVKASSIMCLLQGQGSKRPRRAVPVEG
jgi:hypothetical protein